MQHLCSTLKVILGVWVPGGSVERCTHAQVTISWLAAKDSLSPSLRPSPALALYLKNKH